LGIKVIRYSAFWQLEIDKVYHTIRSSLLRLTIKRGLVIWVCEIFEYCNSANVHYFSYNHYVPKNEFNLLDKKANTN